VIRSEETIAIEFERRLRVVVGEHPDAEAFLLQVNPRVSTQFTGHGSRVLHALEAETGRSFLFEGSEGLALDHFAITFMGTRAEVEERALPFRPGDEVLVEIIEPHMYDVDDAVAKIDGYIISIAGAAPCVGEKRMVRIDEVGRTAASALLLDESGEVVRPARAETSRNGRRARPARSARTPAPDRGDEDEPAQRSTRRARRRRSVADAEDDQTRAEAGLGETPVGLESDPESDPTDVAEPQAPADGDAQEDTGAGDGDGLQSKPRRRGRRGGRRRSAAKAGTAQRPTE
jgi:ribonuclease G